MEEDAKFLKHELSLVLHDLEQRGDLAAVRHQDYPLCFSRDREWNYKQHNILLVILYPTSGETEMIILSFLYRPVGQMRIEYD
jgi:hypothetical protein